MNNDLIMGIIIGVVGLLFFLIIYNGGINITHESVGVRVCNSHDAAFLKIEDNANRVLCIKDSRVIVFEDLRGD